MRSRLVIVVSLILLGCGSATPTPEPVATGPIKAELGQAIEASIGMDGGTLTATAADGTMYTLEVPAGALMSLTEITMTPVRAIEGLPLSGGLAGAVELQPSGTVLARPAVLRIETSRTAGSGQQLAGFSTNDALSVRTLAPVAAEGDTVSVFVFHFSTAGAGFGTTQDVTQFSLGTSVSLDTYMSDVLGFGQPWNDTTRDIGLEIAHDSFAQIVLPGLENATDDHELLVAVADYDHWRSLLDVILNQGVPTFGSPGHNDSAVFLDERAAANAAAHPKLLQAEIGNVQTCGTQASLEAMANALFWQGQAAQFQLDDAASGLDLASVLEDIRNHCAVVELIGSDLPAELPVGSPVNVELGMGVRYANGDLKFVPAEVTLTSTTATVQSTSTTTDGGGLFHTVVTAMADPPVTIHGHACVILPNSFVTSPVCGDFDITAGGGATGQPPAPTGQQGNWGIGIFGTGETSAHCSAIHGQETSATIQLTDTQLSGTWRIAPFCGANGGAVSGTMSASVARNADGLLELQGWVLKITTVVLPTSPGLFRTEKLCAESVGTIDAGTATFAINSSSVSTGEAFGTPSVDGCPPRLQFVVAIGPQP